jgi:hypothetical protein
MGTKRIGIWEVTSIGPEYGPGARQAFVRAVQLGSGQLEGWIQVGTGRGWAKGVGTGTVVSGTGRCTGRHYDLSGREMIHPEPVSEQLRKKYGDRWAKLTIEERAAANRAWEELEEGQQGKTFGGPGFQVPLDSPLTGPFGWQTAIGGEWLFVRGPGDNAPVDEFAIGPMPREKWIHLTNRGRRVPLDTFVDSNGTVWGRWIKLPFMDAARTQADATGAAEAARRREAESRAWYQAAQSGLAARRAIRWGR